MRFLDTNVIVRYLTGDDPANAAASLELLRRLERGEEQVRTSEVILAEAVYILSARAHYGLTHDEIRQRLVPIINLRGLRLPQKELYLRAFDVYATHPALDFEDAITAAYVEREGLEGVYSYDRDFDQISGLTRVEP